MTETARLLFITQPAVSQTLKELEEEAGFKFFERRGNRIRMTTETIALLPSLDRIDEEIQRLTARTVELRDATSGHLAIGSMGPISSGLLAQSIARFTEKRRSVSFSVETLGSRQIVERVRQERIDLGVTLKTNEDIGIVLEPLLRTQLVAILHRSHPLAGKRTISIEDLSGQTVVCHGPETPLGMTLREALGPQTVDGLAGRIDTNQSSTAIALATAGNAVALTHPLNTDLLADRRVRVRPFAPRIPLTVMLVLSRNRPVPRLLATFIAALIAESKLAAASYENSGIVMEVT